MGKTYNFPIETYSPSTTPAIIQLITRGEGFKGSTNATVAEGDVGGGSEVQSSVKEIAGKRAAVASWVGVHC